MRTGTGEILRLLRTVHGWLGIIVLPWVIIIGATGLYLNHSKTVLAWLSGPEIEEASLLTLPNARPVDLDTAGLVAARFWADEFPAEIASVTYHGFEAFRFQKPSGYIFVVKASGHHYVKTDYQRSTYAPDGTLVHHKYYWSRILGELHVRGWIGNAFGRWFADIAAASLVLFGLSGIFLWWIPRAKRIKRALHISRQ